MDRIFFKSEHLASSHCGVTSNSSSSHRITQNDTHTEHDVSKYCGQILKGLQVSSSILTLLIGATLKPRFSTCMSVVFFMGNSMERMCSSVTMTRRRSSAWLITPTPISALAMRSTSWSMSHLVFAVSKGPDIRTGFIDWVLLAPQILRGEPFSAASDVWQLGILVYFW